MVSTPERYDLTTPPRSAAQKVKAKADPPSSEVVIILNPFASVLEKSKHKVKVKYGSYEINRLDGGILESSIVWSLYVSYPEKFIQTFPTQRGIEHIIVNFRELLIIAALSQMLDSKVLYRQGCSQNLDELLAVMASDVIELNSIPEDIGDRLRKYDDQFSEQYSSSLSSRLDMFLDGKKTGSDLWNFWNVIIKYEPLRGNIFFQLSSKLLEIGIAVWTPDQTPGDYIISDFFGVEFKETIHIVSHSDSLEVVSASTTR